MTDETPQWAMEAQAEAACRNGLTVPRAEHERVLAELARNRSDPQRLLWKDDAQTVCPSVSECFEYGDTVRCSPCAIKFAQNAGISPDMSLPRLPEVSRLTRELATCEAELARVREALERLEKALEQIAGSHWERFGIDQTDVEQVPDMSADEAMNVARGALSFDDFVQVKPDRKALGEPTCT